VPLTTKAAVFFGEPEGCPFIATGASRLSPPTRAFDALPDGRFVALVAGSADDLSERAQSFVLNWSEELKRLVPSK
jgi:hypothetical protein